MVTIDELRQEPHWSYSALNTYLNICQAQYFYRYVEQAEVERTSACFPFGKAFHAALTAQVWKSVSCSIDRSGVGMYDGKLSAAG